MSTPTRRSSRRRAADPPAEAHRPLRAVGYRVPVLLDEEFDEQLDEELDGGRADDRAGWSPAVAHPPMWEQWDAPEAVVEPEAALEETPAEDAGADPIVAVAPPLPMGAAWSETGPEPVEDVYDDLDPVQPRSVYLAALRVRHLKPGVLQRVLLVEGVLALAVVLALADLSSPWLIAVLPVVVAALVKLHDLVQEGIERSRAGRPST